MSYFDHLFFFELLRTCGGGGASGVMLANRPSTITSRRRPTLNPSSNHKNQYKHLNPIELQCLPSNCSKPIQIGRRQISSKTCDLQNEYENGNTRPPPSSPSSIGSTLSTNSLIFSSFNSSPSVLTIIDHDHNGQTSNNDSNEAFSSNCSSAASTNKHKTNKRLRLIHSTTR